ncbi:MAG TPA: preprotein translocase YidC [Micromonosporaceae bacterium]|nr:preprotein translocase YidC [Micromonosporaceae bacterium]
MTQDAEPGSAMKRGAAEEASDAPLTETEIEASTPPADGSEHTIVDDASGMGGGASGGSGGGSGLPGHPDSAG